MLDLVYCGRGSAGSFPPARLLFVMVMRYAMPAGLASWSGRREYPIWTVLYCTVDYLLALGAEEDSSPG